MKNIFTKSILIAVDLAANDVATGESTETDNSGKERCFDPLPASVIYSQASCRDRKGYMIRDSFVEGENCELKEICFRPYHTNKIFPNGIRSEDPSEYIYNIDCENCTFSQLVEKVHELFGENFEYENVEATKTSLDIPTRTANKIQCIGPNHLPTEFKHCQVMEGIFLKHDFCPDCDKMKYTCLYFEDSDELSENAVKAQNPSECIN